MREYKRLTNKDWKENYDIFEDVCCDTCTENCGECERNFNALVRLAELEDKIESGKLCDRKEIAKEILNEILFVEGVEGWKENEQLVKFSNKIVDKIEELVKKYGVEVKE